MLVQAFPPIPRVSVSRPVSTLPRGLWCLRTSLQRFPLQSHMGFSRQDSRGGLPMAIPTQDQTEGEPGDQWTPSENQAFWVQDHHRGKSRVSCPERWWCRRLGRTHHRT